LKCQSTYNNGTSIVNVDFTNFIGNYIVETSTGKIGYVKKYTPVNATDPATLHVSIVRGPQTPFNDNTNFIVVQNSNSNIAINYFTSSSSGASGTALLFHLSEGVFFADNNFLYCPDQTVVVGKYTKTPSAVIGLNIVETRQDYIGDSSLLDPALGASNYLAPGADRYMIDLQLTTQTYNIPAVTYPNFIQLTTVVDGIIVQDTTTPIYSEIMNTMAKRTYDTSGDFIVKNYIPNVTLNTQDASKLTLQVSAGSAFVQGYEVETISPTVISLQKAQTTATDTGFSVNTTYGNYVYVSDLDGSLPTINTTYTVEIHNAKTNVSSSTKIGTALVKSIEYVSGFGDNAVFALFLDNISMTSGTFTSARSFVYVGSGSYSSPQLQVDVDGTGFDSTGTMAQLELSDSNQLLFDLPRQYISSLQNVNYYYKQYFTSVVSGNTVSISCKNTDSFAGSGTGLNVIQNYIIVETNSGNFIPADGVTVTLSTPYQATIDFGSNLYNGHTVNIIASVHTQADTYKTKTLVSNYVAAPWTVNDKIPHDLGKSDIFQLNYMYEYPVTSLYRSTWSSSTSYNMGDVVVIGTAAYISTLSSNTNNPTTGTGWAALVNKVNMYTLDNGQRDTYYDHGTVTRNSLPAAPLDVLPIFSYFTHSGTGYISAQSYPISTIGYGSIPTYTSRNNNVLYNLRDCIDFRPRRNDDEVATFTFANHQIPETITNADVITDLTYYLGRIDKVVITRDGLFKIIQGVPAYLNPQAPGNQSDALTLFTLTYNPYTNSPSDVTVQVVPHKRYTMKDISGLDTRITNLEYYSALSVLESQVNSQTLTSNNGVALFKNGFIADAFTGSGVGDVTNVEYRSSVDYSNNLSRPLYLADNVMLNYIGALSNTTSGTSSWSSLVTVPYTSETFVNQPIASGTISANPFGVVSFVGDLKLSPESDIWFDVNTAPSVIVNTGGQNDNYQYYNSIETQWNAWQAVWTGESVNEAATIAPTVTGALTSTVLSQSVAISPGVTTSTANFILNQSAVPYARSKRIDFKVDGMSPNTQIYMFINGLNMTGYMYPYSVGSQTGFSTVVTDASGAASGFIMFPNNNTIKFLTGKETITLCDNAINPAVSSCYAQATFYSQGLLETLSPLLVSTKPNSRVVGQLQLNATDNATDTNGTVVNTIPTAPIAPANYSLVPDHTQVHQGTTINFLFTTQNVPPGGTYNANISGSITNTNLGNGFTLGNTVIRTVGTKTQSQAAVSIPILPGTITDVNNKYIILEVDVPYDPIYGAAATYTSNVAIISDITASFEVSAPSYIQAGNQMSITFYGTNMNSAQTINYAITGQAAGQFTSVNSSLTSGSFTLSTPSSSNTLTYNINSSYAPTTSADKFILTYTLPDSTTKVISIPVINNATYSLVPNVTSQMAGNTFLVTLNTTGVPNGNTVPYTISGVTSTQINSAPLTGNFTVSNNTANLLITTTSSAISSCTDFHITLTNYTPTVYTDVQVTVVPTVPTSVTLTSVNSGQPVPTAIANAPKNGTFYYVNSSTGYNSSTDLGHNFGLDPNGQFNSTLPINFAPGSYQLDFYFSNNTSVKGVPLVLSKVPVVATPSYTLASNVSSLVAGNTFLISLATTNVTPGNTVPYTISGVTSAQLNGASLTGTFTTNSSGQANVALTTVAGQFSANTTATLTLNGITPSVASSVLVYKPIAVAPTPIAITINGITNAPSTAQLGSTVTWSVANGPSNGTFYYAQQSGGNSITYTLNSSGAASGSLFLDPASFTAGNYTLIYHFSDGRTVTENFTITAIPGPQFFVAAPQTVNDGDAIGIGVASLGQSAPITAPFTITNSNNYYIDNGVVGQNATLNITGSPNYSGYVDNYADLLILYNDGVNGTQNYATVYPNPTQTTYANATDEYNQQQSNSGYFGYIKQGKAAFGQYHWNNWGRNDGRTLPIYSQISGTITVADGASNSAGLAMILNALHGDAETSGTLTLNIGAPINITKTITVNHTAASLLPPNLPTAPTNPTTTTTVVNTPSGPVTQLGDFVDSPLTIPAAVSQYTYLTDNVSYSSLVGNPAAAGKIWINSSQTDVANTVAQALAAYVRRPDILNQNPTLIPLMSFTNQVFQLQYATDQLQPAWYPVNSSAWQTQDTSGFNSNYGVWLNAGTDPLAGQKITVYREWVCPADGTYTMILGADDFATAYLDVGGNWGTGTPVLTFDTSGAGSTTLQYAQSNGITGSHGAAPSNYWVSGSAFVPAGTHLLRFDVENYKVGNDTWATNPAFFAAAIYSGTVTNPSGQYPIWDTRSNAAAVTIPVGPGLTQDQAIAQVEQNINVAATQNGYTIGGRSQFLACTTDPLSQTFFVPAGAYPNGVFLTGISLYFSDVASNLPIFAQIRPTVNGYPSSDTVIPLSTVWKHPYEIATSTDGSQETVFGFTDPVYLAPGQYAIVVGSNSTEYQLYYATVGQKQIGSPNIVSAQPNVGVLFKSKNASTWIADESSDLAFKLYKAQFNTNQVYEAIFYSAAPNRSFDFDLVDITTQELDFNNTTSITYGIKNQVDGVFDSSFTQVLANRNVNLKATRNNTAIGDTIVKADLFTTDPNVSPVIDLDRMSLIMIENIISSKSQQNIPETTYSGGDAAAKYVTRAVTLTSGFDAHNMDVYFDANMQSSTSIEVYVKVLAADDASPFNTRPWIQVPNASSNITYSSNYTDFMEQHYTLPNITYVSNGVTYRNFQTFAIKVVMYSDNSVVVPQIRNFRAIASS
jgi:hypothetical protein